MKISDELLDEYIELVKKKRNEDIDRQTAYQEYYKLIMVVGILYLPKKVMRWFEIQIDT